MKARRLRLLFLLWVAGSAGCSASSGNAGPVQAGGFGGTITPAGGAGTPALPGAGGSGAVSPLPPGGAAGTVGAGGSSPTRPPGSGATTAAGGAPPGAGGAAAAGGHSGLCSSTFVDCNGDPADGCETNLETDAMNCGGCKMACPSAPNASPYCFVGECHYGCAAGFGDCNGKPDDGCEASLLTDKANCGACRLSCGDTECLNGGCKCAGTSVKPQKIPLDMYIVFDQSLSMNDMVTGGSKWSVIVGALTTFVQNSMSAGLGVGISYFPVLLKNAPTSCAMDSDCMSFGTCTGGFVNGTTHLGGICSKTDTCVAANYVPDVPIDTLPGVAASIVSSLGAHSPVGSTPTYPALQGGYDYTKMWAANHPDHKTILVLATDGVPSGCDINTNNVSTIAQNLVTPAAMAAQPILTFVIGVGASLTSLNQIAMAGGTSQALIVDTGSGDPGGDFLAAMKKIGASPALGCQYAIPAPPTGTPDFGKVNVQLTPDMGTPRVLKRVGDVSGCTPTDGGWYYDNNTTPKQIILCNSTCTSINNGVSVQVDVVLGCASIG